MSHRRPPTVADRHIESFERSNTAISSLVTSGCDSFSLTAMQASAYLRSMAGYADVDPSHVSMLVSTDPRFVIPEDVSLWSRWRTCRQVFRFDRRLSEELCGTPAPRDMPLDPLKRLPYPCMFVETAIDVPTNLGTRRRSRGFFCWRDGTIADTTNPDLANSVDSLSVMFVYDDAPRGCTSIELCHDTLGEAIDVILEEDMRSLERASKSYVMPVTEGYLDDLEGMFSAIVAHLLYLVSEDSDQEVTYRPSGNARKRTSPSTIHEVGTRVGRSLGKGAVRYVSRGSGDGRTVRPHVRAGHWHHFWRGPRDGKRELVLRWVAPTMVNVGEVDTVVHYA